MRAPPPAPSLPSAARILDLGGAWRLRQDDARPALDARVPGNVHLDLLRAGRIPDPFPVDREERVQWVGAAAWTYEREFEAPEDLRRRRRVLLRCEGLDTLAEVRLNDRLLARTDNMFRTWEFDVGGRLRAGRNRISVRFASTLPVIRRLQRKRRMNSWNSEFGPPEALGRPWVRKQPCNYGWDWGPRLVTCGIWRPIRLVAFGTARLRDVEVRQEHARGRVRLRVAVDADRAGSPALSARVRVLFRGRPVASASVPLRGARAEARLEVRTPRLWWPNGMGEQALYDVRVELVDRAGRVLDTGARRVGLRTLRLARRKDRWGESFQFEANGVPFFAKGANWIPADAILARLTWDDYHRLASDAAAANMNMLRVWGGGIYEDDAFYDLCDELGLCVWQDFMFACATYPAFDPSFMASVRAEAEDNVRRLRHHPCLALWCGNNELEQGCVGPKWTGRQMSWKDYRRLFDRLLPGVVRRLDPDRDYWPSSPHSPRGDRDDFNNPRCGDAHLWDVWHGGKPFEWYRSCPHRFNSEFGFQSFPEPRTVRGYTRPEDRNLTSPVMEFHQRSGVGNRAILQQMLDWFRVPRGFDEALWLSQVLQGLGIKYGVEHWRRSMPRGMGTLYWQLNDCWPVASWSSIDFHGRWKALHYMARRFFAPCLVSAVEDRASGSMEIHATSDLPRPARGRVRWTLTTPDGRALRAGRIAVRLRPRSSARVATLDLARDLRARGPAALMLWLELEVGGRVVSTEMASFARPKQFDLPDPAIRARARALGDGRFEVRLSARAPALWAWLELRGADARCSDNFFHLRPGRPASVEVAPARRMGLAEFRRRLRVRSLADTG
jgi:beta-mannosidase